MPETTFSERDGQRSCAHRRTILTHSISGLLLVGRIDGSVSAVEGETGNIRWTFDSGSPLVSTSQDVSSNVQVFPGIDGSIYVLHDIGSSSSNDDHANMPKLEVRATALRVTSLSSYTTSVVQLSRVTVADLVENSPSMAADGSVIVGSLSTTLYYIDSDSGELLKKFSDVECSEMETTTFDGTCCSDVT